MNKHTMEAFAIINQENIIGSFFVGVDYVLIKYIKRKRINLWDIY